jgi:hypothetical protein
LGVSSLDLEEVNDVCASSSLLLEEQAFQFLHLAIHSSQVLVQGL